MNCSRRFETNLRTPEANCLSFMWFFSSGTGTEINIASLSQVLYYCSAAIALNSGETECSNLVIRAHQLKKENGVEESFSRRQV